jgi:hypothetical protein
VSLRITINSTGNDACGAFETYVSGVTYLAFSKLYDIHFSTLHGASFVHVKFLGTEFRRATTTVSGMLGSCPSMLNIFAYQYVVSVFCCLLTTSSRLSECGFICDAGCLRCSDDKSLPAAAGSFTVKLLQLLLEGVQTLYALQTGEFLRRLPWRIFVQCTIDDCYAWGWGSWHRNAVHKKQMRQPSPRNR